MSFTPGPAIGSTAEGTIAFTSTRDGDPEVYLMNADGTNLRQLTKNTHSDRSPSWSPDGTQITFQSDRDGDSEIFTMNADGTNVRQLTKNTHSDTSPSWSPDGRHIAFVSNRDGDSDIFVMNHLGTNQTLLTNNRISDLMPSWSPDGAQIVFQSDRDGDSEIFTMDADGAKVRQLTHNTRSDASPSWSPDGQHIAFSSGGQARLAILVMDADGSDLKRLTTGGDFRDEWPSWSPDSASVLFTRSGQLFQVKADGTDLRQVTSFDGIHGISTSSWSSQGVLRGSDLFDDLPVGHWADVATGWVVSNGIAQLTGSRTLGPDGTVTRAEMVAYLRRALAILPNSPVQEPGYDGVIVFTSHRDGWNQIEAIDADGTNHRPITYTASRDRSASWSPDGSQIAFESDRDGDFEIFAVGVDGTQLRQITNNEVDDWAPVWSPDGSKIAYMSRRRGTDGIWYRQVMVMSADGTGQRQLTTTNRSSGSATWSPDGTRIAFALSRRVSPGSQGTYYQLMTVGANGTNPRSVTSEDYSAFSPSWSPDGAKIAFTGRPRDGGYYQIYVVNPDGTGQRQLTDTYRDNFSSSWSPDGTHIAFASERDGNPRDLHHESRRQRTPPTHEQRQEHPLRPSLVVGNHPCRIGGLHRRAAGTPSRPSNWLGVFQRRDNRSRRRPLRSRGNGDARADGDFLAQSRHAGRRLTPPRIGNGANVQKEPDYGSLARGYGRTGLVGGLPGPICPFRGPNRPGGR